MPAVFANPYASRSQHISSPKIAQLRLESDTNTPEIVSADNRNFQVFHLLVKDIVHIHINLQVFC
jgi:hypothetical protein